MMTAIEVDIKVPPTCQGEGNVTNGLVIDGIEEQRLVMALHQLEISRLNLATLAVCCAS